MFGSRYFGPRYFGPRYWGGDSSLPPPAVTGRGQAGTPRGRGILLAES